MNLPEIVWLSYFKFSFKKTSNKLHFLYLFWRKVKKVNSIKEDWNQLSKFTMMTISYISICHSFYLQSNTCWIVYSERSAVFSNRAIYKWWWANGPQKEVAAAAGSRKASNRLRWRRHSARPILLDVPAGRRFFLLYFARAAFFLLVSP